jgi:hypothetical protein
VDVVEDVGVKRTAKAILLLTINIDTKKRVIPTRERKFFDAKKNQ